jgi:hypothetical protein
MAHRHAWVAAICSCLFLAGPVLAEEAEGTTSGPAAGTDVMPSTAIEKQYEGRSTTAEEPPTGAPAAAGMPGVEGAPGTQSGAEVEPAPAPAK